MGQEGTQYILGWIQELFLLSHIFVEQFMDFDLMEKMFRGRFL